MATQDRALMSKQAFAQAIEEYIERHNVRPGEQGPRDLNTLDQAGVRNMFQGNYLNIQLSTVIQKQDSPQLKQKLMEDNTDLMSTEKENPELCVKYSRKLSVTNY